MTVISDEALLARLPGIRIDHDNKEYYRGLLEHRLLINRCAGCGTYHQPPKASCPKCWSWDIVPTEVSGRGEIYLFSLMNTQAALDDPGAPLPVAAIDLVEGVRFTSSLINCPKDKVAIGLAVELVWTEQDGMPFPAFQPLRGAAS